MSLQENPDEPPPTAVLSNHQEDIISRQAEAVFFRDYVPMVDEKLVLTAFHTDIAPTEEPADVVRTWTATLMELLYASVNKMIDPRPIRFVLEFVDIAAGCGGDERMKLIAREVILEANKQVLADASYYNHETLFTNFERFGELVDVSACETWEEAKLRIREIRDDLGPDGWDTFRRTMIQDAALQLLFTNVNGKCLQYAAEYLEQWKNYEEACLRLHRYAAIFSRQRGMVDMEAVGKPIARIMKDGKISEEFRKFDPTIHHIWRWRNVLLQLLHRESHVFKKTVDPYVARRLNTGQQEQECFFRWNEWNKYRADPEVEAMVLELPEGKLIFAEQGAYEETFESEDLEISLSSDDFVLDDRTLISKSFDRGIEKIRNAVGTVGGGFPSSFHTKPDLTQEGLSANPNAKDTLMTLGNNRVPVSYPSHLVFQKKPQWTDLVHLMPNAELMKTWYAKSFLAKRWKTVHILQQPCIMELFVNRPSTPPSSPKTRLAERQTSNLKEGENETSKLVYSNLEDVKWFMRTAWPEIIPKLEAGQGGEEELLNKPWAEKITQEDWVEWIQENYLDTVLSGDTVWQSSGFIRWSNDNKRRAAQHNPKMPVLDDMLDPHSSLMPTMEDILKFQKDNASKRYVMRKPRGKQPKLFHPAWDAKTLPFLVEPTPELPKDIVQDRKRLTVIDRRLGDNIELPRDHYAHSLLEQLFDILLHPGNLRHYAIILRAKGTKFSSPKNMQTEPGPTASEIVNLTRLLATCPPIVTIMDTEVGDDIHCYGLHKRYTGASKTIHLNGSIFYCIEDSIHHGRPTSLFLLTLFMTLAHELAHYIGSLIHGWTWDTPHGLWYVGVEDVASKLKDQGKCSFAEMGEVLEWLMFGVLIEVPLFNYVIQNFEDGREMYGLVRFPDGVRWSTNRKRMMKHHPRINHIQAAVLLKNIHPVRRLYPEEWDVFTRPQGHWVKFAALWESMNAVEWPAKFNVFPESSEQVIDVDAVKAGRPIRGMSDRVMIREHTIARARVLEEMYWRLTNDIPESIQMPDEIRTVNPNAEIDDASEHPLEEEQRPKTTKEQLAEMRTEWQQKYEEDILAVRQFNSNVEAALRQQGVASSQGWTFCLCALPMLLFLLVSTVGAELGGRVEVYHRLESEVGRSFVQWDFIMLTVAIMMPVVLVFVDTDGIKAKGKRVVEKVERKFRMLRGAKVEKVETVEEETEKWAIFAESLKGMKAPKWVGGLLGRTQKTVAGPSERVEG